MLWLKARLRYSFSEPSVAIRGFEYSCTRHSRRGESALPVNTAWTPDTYTLCALDLDIDIFWVQKFRMVAELGATGLW